MSEGDDTLRGEIEQTIATLRGEAEDLLERSIEERHHEDIADQLEHRADQLEAAYEATRDGDETGDTDTPYSGGVFNTMFVPNDGLEEHDPVGDFEARFNDRDFFRHDDLDVVFSRTAEWYDQRDTTSGEGNVAVTIGPTDAIQFPEVDQPYHTDDDRDPYLDLLAAMQPGLLITVNGSPNTGAGTGELKVTNVDTHAPRVDARETGPGRRVRIYEHPESGLIAEEIHDDGTGGRETPVETIEVVGIA